MKNIFKIKYLRNIFIVSSIIALTLPTTVIFFIYPSFTAQLTKHTEDEALGVARHLMFMIIADQNELTNESLQVEALKNVQKAFKLMKLKIFSKPGEVIYSTVSKEIGTMNKSRVFHDIIAKGKVYTKVVRKDSKSLEGAVVTADVVETYVPIIKNNNFIGAFEIYYDITGRKERLDKLLSTVSVVLFILPFILMGTIIAVLINAGKNIVGREQTEEALRQSEKKYYDLYDNAPDMHFSVNAKTAIILECNQTLVNALGYTKEEIIGRPIFDMYTFDSAEYAKANVFPLIAKIGIIKDEELQLQRKDGSQINVSMNVSAVRDEKGNVLYSRSTWRDISVRKQAEEALRESEEKYRLLVKNLTSIAYIGYKDWSVEFFDEKIELLTGYSADEFNSKRMKWDDIIIEEDIETAKEIFIKALKTDKSYVREYRIKSKTGSIFWIEERGQIVCNNNGEIESVNGTFFDKTETKKLEAQLQQAQKLESIGILAGGMAHDFNNLLAVIMGNISLAEEDIRPEIGTSENLKEAAKASLRAKELTARLITFSKGGAPVKEMASIGDLVNDSVNFTLSGSNINCEFSIPDDIQTAKIDGNQMKQVIQNITINAMEATSGKGAIKVYCQNVTIGQEDASPLKEGKYVKISIKDHGPGISKENIQKIFDPYFSTKEMGANKGQGLGLAICYSIVENHDGHITVESEVSVGTTFTIYLPVAVEEIVGIKPVKMVEPEKPAVRTGNILVMDDEEMIRNLSRQVLSRLGYEPALAEDGAEAIELYKRAIDSGMPFDAVILDLTVKGGMGGKDTVKALLEIDPQVKAIVSNGYSNDPVLTNFRAYGFIGALPKPYTVKDLSDMLNQILGKS